MKKIITVITVCYNEQEKIAETIHSVLAQMNPEVEYVIVDGASTDKTLDVINRIVETVPQYQDSVRIISEPDCGIYDAMNKGIDMATGAYVIFINSGDILHYLPLDGLKEHMADDCFAVAYPVAMDKENNIFVPSYGKKLKTHNTLHHQGMFYKRRYMQKYDIRYRIFADFDYNQKLYKKNAKVEICADVSAVSMHDTEGVSHSPRYAQELLIIILRNFGLLYCCLGFLYALFNMIRNRIKKLMG
jgi:glycosyltransferase involved in cell wall biosynthesis